MYGPDWYSTTQEQKRFFAEQRKHLYEMNRRDIPARFPPANPRPENPISQRAWDQIAQQDANRF